MITINSISFSKLKALNHSPKRLHQYITSPKDTDAMTAGSVLDCLLFTPAEFSDKFAIAPDVDRRTKDGKAQYAEFLETVNGRTIITNDDVDDAQALIAAISDCPTVQLLGLLKPEAEDGYGFKFQQGIGFDAFGMKHAGVLDAIGRDSFGHLTIWDLKRINSARTGADLKWTVLDSLYHVQAAIYTHLYNQTEGLNYYLICVDNSGNVTPLKFSFDTLEKGRAKWEYLVGVVNALNASQDWQRGPEYFSESGLFFEI